MAIDRDTEIKRTEIARRSTQTRTGTAAGGAALRKQVNPVGPSQVDHSRDEGEADGRADAPRSDIGTQAWPKPPSPAEMELKAVHYQMDMANKHRRPSAQPLMALPQRKYVAKCEFGQQLYTYYEGQLPRCPECENIMRTISEIGG